MERIQGGVAMPEVRGLVATETHKACVAALIEVGRLPDPAKKVPAAKKVPSKPKPAAPTDTTATPDATVETPAETIETAPI
jgi:hypothetical protein